MFDFVGVFRLDNICSCDLCLGHGPCHWLMRQNDSSFADSTHLGFADYSSQNKTKDGLWLSRPCWHLCIYIFIWADSLTRLGELLDYLKHSGHRLYVMWPHGAIIKCFILVLDQFDIKPTLSAADTSISSAALHLERLSPISITS